MSNEGHTILSRGEAGSCFKISSTSRPGPPPLFTSTTSMSGLASAWGDERNLGRQEIEGKAAGGPWAEGGPQRYYVVMHGRHEVGSMAISSLIAECADRWVGRWVRVGMQRPHPHFLQFLRDKARS